MKLLPTMDQTRKLCEVTFARGRRSAPTRCWARGGRRLGAARARARPGHGGALRRDVRRRAAVLDMTIDYAKIRVAFGKPIGSYQGVKHKAADMLVEVENAKSLTYYAAWAVDENAPEAPLAASMAKAYVSDAYRRVAGAGIQLHGGIGFTWEHDLHLYFKRAKSGAGVRRRTIGELAELAGVGASGASLRSEDPAWSRSRRRRSCCQPAAGAPEPLEV